MFGAAALGSLADVVVTVGAVDELVLVAVDEGAGMVFVAAQGVEAGAGGEVSEHVGVVAEITVGPPAGFHLSARIETGRLLGLVGIDVGPPGLGVTDEVDLGVPGEDTPELVEVDVVFFVLEVLKNGDVEVLGDVAEEGHVGAEDIEKELLFADADGALAEVLFENLLSFGVVGDFVGEEDEAVGVAFGDFHAAVVAGSADFEAVGAAGGEEDGLGCTHDLLVFEQDVVGTAGVVGVLVDVDDFLLGSGLAKGSGGGSGQEVPSVHG